MAVLKELVRSGLEELSDTAFQERVWLGSSASEMSSFEECVSKLYEDSGLDLALENRQPVYRPDLDNELRELGALLSKIDGMRAPSDILTDPLMGRARILAAKILTQVTDVTPDDTEDSGD